MPDFSFSIFGADNIINPQNPGSLPAEDSTFRSDLQPGDQITWVDGGEKATVTVSNNDNLFDEAQNDQTLTNPVTFNGISYSAGQIVTPTYSIVFLGDDGVTYTFTSFNFSPNTNNEEPDVFFWEGLRPPANTVLTVQTEINPTGSTSRDFNTFVCFVSGTNIWENERNVPVQDIKKGDLIKTYDGQIAKVIWRGSKKITSEVLEVNPKLRPVRITKGSLGAGLPDRDLLVSRQHRILVNAKAAFRMFDQEVLVPAIKLIELPGIYIDETVTEFEYVHLLFKSHELIYAEGAPAESLLTGQEALKAISRDYHHEIKSLFPDIMSKSSSMASVRFIPSGSEAKKLIYRLVKNKKSLLDAMKLQDSDKRLVA